MSESLDLKMLRVAGARKKMSDADLDAAARLERLKLDRLAATLALAAAVQRMVEAATPTRPSARPAARPSARMTGDQIGRAHAARYRAMAGASAAVGYLDLVRGQIKNLPAAMLAHLGR